MTDDNEADCPKCEKFGDDCGEHAPSWEELANYWKAEAERRQPDARIAREAVIDECAKVAEQLNGWGTKPCPELADHIAKAIRALAE